MAVKLEKIIEAMEAFAPKGLKESYDNVGLMIGDKDSEISKVLLALDCTLEVVEEAIKHGVELIITHHPLLFKKPASITMDSLQGRKIIKLISNDINLYSSHTNLDSVHEGLNDTFMEIIEAKDIEILEENEEYPGESHGIGRIGNIEEVTLKELINKLKKCFGVECLRYAGDENQTVSRIAVINGSGEGYLDTAYKLGAHCVITGDTTYHFVSDYNEMGLAIIDLGHFHSEWFVYLKLMEKIRNTSEDLKDIEFIASKTTRDPYRYQ